VTRRVAVAWVAGALLLLVGFLGFRALTREALSARVRPGAVETWLARGARSLAFSAELRARPNPLTSTPLALAEGRDHFADHCAFCHGNDGGGDTAINRGLFPPAPDLREGATRGLTDGELFAIIRNGIRWSGMSGWGGEDEENWKLVLFIRHLPELEPAELALMQEENGLGAP